MVFRFSCRSIYAMSRADWLCILMIILGIILFLVGANYYNSAAGWAGVLLFVGGIVGLLILFVYNMLRDRSEETPKKEADASA
jgi:hypothetical protein